MTTKKKILITATVILSVAVLICAGIIVFNGFGLVEEYDFGLGAYYYADIPGFEKILNEDAFKTYIPFWFHAILFLIWGWIIYRLWIWIDRK